MNTQSSIVSHHPIVTAPIQEAQKSTPATEASTALYQAVPTHLADPKPPLNMTVLPLSTQTFGHAGYPACSSTDIIESGSFPTCSSSTDLQSSSSKHDRDDSTASTGKVPRGQHSPHKGSSAAGSSTYHNFFSKRFQRASSDEQTTRLKRLSTAPDDSTLTNKSGFFSHITSKRFYRIEEEEREPSSTKRLSSPQQRPMSYCERGCYASLLHKRDRGSTPADIEAVMPKYNRGSQEDDLLISMSLLSLAPASQNKRRATTIRLRITEVAGVTEAWRASGTLYYRGGWELGMPHGEGEYFRPNGSTRYRGQIFNNRFHGFGTSYRRDGSLEYQGYWHSGQHVAPPSFLSDSPYSSGCDRTIHGLPPVPPESQERRILGVRTAAVVSNRSTSQIETNGQQENSPDQTNA